jgi:gliding motility-associated-like protein
MEEDGYITLNIANSASFSEDLEFEWTLPDGSKYITQEYGLYVNQSGIYKVKTSTSNGCTSTETSIDVTLKALPNLTLDANFEDGECTSETPQITAIVESDMTLDENNLIFNWILPNGTVKTTNTGTIDIIESGLYKVYVSGVDVCTSNTVEIEVDYRPIPKIDIVASWDQLSCTNETVYIEAQLINAGFFANILQLTYEWQLPDGSIIVNNQSKLQVTEPGNYKVTASSPLSCIGDTEEIEIIYKPIPELNIYANWNREDCMDGDEYIEVEIDNIDNPEFLNNITYYWTRPDNTTITTTEPRLLANMPGEFKVYAVSEDMCEGSEVSIDVDYLITPEFTVEEIDICEGSDGILEVVLDNDYLSYNLLKFTWYKNGTTIVKEGIGSNFKTLSVSSNEFAGTSTISYTVVVSNSIGCNYTNSTNVNLLDLPVFDLGDDLTICTIETATIELDIDDYDEVIWSDGSNGNSINVGTGGTYWATVYRNGCSYTDSINVNTKPFPNFDIEILRYECSEKQMILSANIENEDGVEFYWNTGEKTSQIIISKGGSYTLAISKNGCSSAKLIDIDDNFFRDLNTFEEVKVCDGSEVTLKPSVPFEYIQWDTGETTDSIVVKEGGLYGATITNAFFCNARAEFQVEVGEAPVIKNLTVSEEAISFDVVGDFAPYRYFIDDEEFYSRTIANKFAKGTHILNVIDEVGCDCSAEFFVEDPIKIPDLITPNDDGFNDYFEIFDLKKYPKSVVRIYDRYGRLLHKSPGKTLRWDGTFNGSLVPSTDYWYHIDVYADGTRVYTGHFALIR